MKVFPPPFRAMSMIDNGRKGEGGALTDARGTKAGLGRLDYPVRIP